MRITARSVFVGPSQYAHFPVIRLELDLGVLEQWPTGRLGPQFVDALVAALPVARPAGLAWPHRSARPVPPPLAGEGIVGYAATLSR